MIKGAIFDVDGTLLDSMPMWDHAGERFLQSLGITAEPNLEKVLFSITMEQGAAYMKEHYQLKLSVSEIRQGINHTIEQFYAYEAMPKSGVADFLAFLDAQGIPMTIATSTDRCHIEAALQRLNLLHYFKKIFTCSEVGCGKQHPLIFRQAAECMHTRPEETWVFEDACHAARTAYQDGFQVVGVYDESSADVQEELKKVCHLYVSGLQTSLLMSMMCNGEEG